MKFTTCHYFKYLDHAQLSLCFYSNGYLMSLFHVHTGSVYFIYFGISRAVEGDFSLGNTGLQNGSRRQCHGGVNSAAPETKRV